MKALFWVLALFALAAGLTVAAHFSNSYLLLVLPPYRIEVSLALALILLAAAFSLGYGALRIAINLLELPEKARRYHEQRRQQKGQALLQEALHAYFAGRHEQAERAAAECIELGQQVQLAAAIAARAAQSIKAPERRERHLATALSAGGANILPVMARAEFLLDERRPQEALAALAMLKEKHVAALRLELRAQQQLQNWEQALVLIEQLQAQNGLGAAQAEELRHLAHAEMLKRCGPDQLGKYWEGIAEPDRLNGYVALTAARAFLALNQHGQAEEILERSLEHEWDPHLLALYPDCATDDTGPLIAWAKQQLPGHHDDAVLLLVLGQLYLHSDAERARAWLQASLDKEPTHTAHLMLAQFHQQRGDEAQANRHYQEALQLALQQLRNSSGGRRKTAL
ncbi:MAG: heme biosynthesis HemY N-terminal domain-containing protein [Pseudomonadota bacterium]